MAGGLSKRCSILLAAAVLIAGQIVTANDPPDAANTAAADNTGAGDETTESGTTASPAVDESHDTTVLPSATSPVADTSPQSGHDDPGAVTGTPTGDTASVESTAGGQPAVEPSSSSADGAHEAATSPATSFESSQSDASSDGHTPAVVDDTLTTAAAPGAEQHTSSHDSSSGTSRSADADSLAGGSTTDTETVTTSGPLESSDSPNITDAAAVETAATTQHDTDPSSSTLVDTAAYLTVSDSIITSLDTDTSPSSLDANATSVAPGAGAEQAGDVDDSTTEASDVTQTSGVQQLDSRPPYDKLPPTFKENVVQTTMGIAADMTTPNDAWLNFTNALRDQLSKNVAKGNQRRKRQDKDASVTVHDLAGSPKGTDKPGEYVFEYYVTDKDKKLIPADRVIAAADAASKDYCCADKFTVVKTIGRSYPSPPSKLGESHEYDDNPHYVKAILGIIGAMAGLVIIVILVVWLVHHRRTRSFQLAKTSHGGGSSNGYTLSGVENPVMAEEMQSEPKVAAQLSSKPTNGHAALDKADEAAMIIPLDQLQGDANV